MTSLLKKRIKARIEIEVISVQGLPTKLHGKPIYIEYKRGTDLSGKSDRFVVTDENMETGYPFQFDISLFYTESKGEKKFQPKKLVFYVTTDKAKDSKSTLTIGKVEYDLAKVATPGKFDPVQVIHLKGKEKKDKHLVLTVRFNTEWLKVDGKKLVKRDAKVVTDESSKKKKSKKSKDKGGESTTPDVIPADLYDDLPDLDDFSDTKDTMHIDGEQYDLITDTDVSEVEDMSEWEEPSEVEYFTDGDSFQSDESPDPISQPVEVDDLSPVVSKKSKKEIIEEENKKLEKLRKDSGEVHDVKHEKEAMKDTQVVTSSKEKDKKKENRLSDDLTPTVEAEKKKKSKLKFGLFSHKKKHEKKSSISSDDAIFASPDEKSDQILLLEDRVRQLESELSIYKASKKDKKGNSLQAKVNEDLNREVESLRASLRAKEAEISKVRTEMNHLKEGSMNGNDPKQVLTVKNLERELNDVKGKLETSKANMFHLETITNYLLNAPWTYDNQGNNQAALELANMLVAQKFLERDQSDEQAHDFLKTILVHYSRQIKAREHDLFNLVGYLKWGTTLLMTILSTTDIIDELQPDSHITWASNIEKNGIIMRIDSVQDGQDVLHKYDIEKDFDTKADEDGTPIAFLDILDSWISVIYALIIACMTKEFDESKLCDMFFQQPIQANSRAKKTVISFSYYALKLSKFIRFLTTHQFNDTVVSQVLSQIFHWTSVLVVNNIIATKNLCTATIGYSVKILFSQIEQWLFSNLSKQIVPRICDQFIIMREAANVLTIDKNCFDDKDVLYSAFINLNVAQIHIILEQFQADEFSPDDVPISTLELLKSEIRRTNAKVTHLEGTNLLNFKEN